MLFVEKIAFKNGGERSVWDIFLLDLERF